MTGQSIGPRQEKLLVVEDDDFSQQVIQLYLKKSGFENVTSALDGRQALDFLREQKFDLVLLDLNLPRISGMEILNRLNAEGTVRDIPIIVITSLANVEETKEALDLGAEDYLPKPFNTRLLQDRINACLEKHRIERLLAAQAEESRRMLDRGLDLQALWAEPATLPLGDRDCLSSQGLFAPHPLPSGGFLASFGLRGGRVGFVAGHVGGSGIEAALHAAHARETLTGMLRRARGPEEFAGLARDAKIEGDFVIGSIEPDRSMAHAARGIFALFDVDKNGGVRAWSDRTLAAEGGLLILVQDPKNPLLHERTIPSRLGATSGGVPGAALDGLATLAARSVDENGPMAQIAALLLN